MSKVLEHIVKDKLLTYISANHLEDPNQHGFVSKCSVISNLLISDSILIKSLDRNILVDMILFEFSKAYDRVPHSHLLHCLKLLGICGFFLSWLSDFLSGRFQRVSVWDHSSSSISVLGGVFQDSVLGPALYSIYTSSMSNLINHAHYLFYADDLKLIMPLTSVTSLTDLQSDLYRLDKWATQWGIFFNKDKSHVLVLGSNNSKHVYMCGNFSLIAVDSADDLGLLREATSPSRYNLHIQHAIIKKSYGVLFLTLLGLLSRCLNIMHKVFVSYIRPIIEFAAVLWFPHTVLQRQQVERVQRLFTRIISGFSSLSYERRLSWLKM